MPYQRTVIREARMVWGMDAPVPVIGAQIEQESGWNPRACSTYACGLAQFTPATAAWISGVYRELGRAAPMNPEWAIRALIRYDYMLYSQIQSVTRNCDHWAFTLSAYNGGMGWVDRDRSLAKAKGSDPNRWFGAVELYSARGHNAFVENRGYPRRILLVLQNGYASWGVMVTCRQSS